MKKRILALSALIITVSAMAQEEKFTVELEKTVVSAEKFVTNVRETTKNVSVIEKEEIKKSGAKSLIDLFKTIPGVTVSEGYTGNGIIDIRGQGAGVHSNVLVLLNGVSLNTIDLAGPDLSIIDVNNIERIEIIPSGGVVYGDKAVGGVVNIITKSQGSSIKLETGSFGYENFGANINEKIGDFSIHTDFSRALKDGYRENTNSKKENFGLGLAYDINESNKISFSYSYNESDILYAGSLTKAQLEVDRTDSISGSGAFFTRKNNYSLAYEYNKDNLKIENTVNFNKKFSEGWSKINTSYLNNDFKVKYNSGKNSIIAGLDISEGNSETDENDKVIKNQLGAFVTDTYKFGDKLSLNTGYRNENVKLSFPSGKEKKYNENLFSTGLNYLYSETGSFYSSFEQNYRTPNTDEYRYGIYSWTPPYSLTGYGYIEDLKPQLSNTLELGIRDYFGNTYFIGAIFNTLTENEIFYNSLTYNNENIPGNTERKGLELSAKTYLGALIVSQGYTYIEAKIKDGTYEGKSIPWVPENKYSIKSEYDLNDLSLGLEYSYVGSMFAISDWENKAGKIEAYSTVNLSSSYKFKELNLFGGVNNLFDEKFNNYAVYSTSKKRIGYYPAEERNYYLGLSYEF